MWGENIHLLHSPAELPSVEPVNMVLAVDLGIRPLLCGTAPLTDFQKSCDLSLEMMVLN